MGKVQNFTVEVEYHLDSSDTGILMIGFNNGNEQDMHSLISDASGLLIRYWDYVSCHRYR